MKRTSSFKTSNVNLQISSPLLQLPVASFSRRSNRQQERSSVLFLVGGLFALQAIVLGVALTWLFFHSDSPFVTDIEVSFHVPETREVKQHVLPSPPVFSDGNVTASVGNEQSTQISSPPPAVVALAPISPPPETLKLRGMEITQGIQVFNEPELPQCYPNENDPDYVFCNNSMPLVAKRHTMVRVYLGCNGACPTGETSVQLRLFKDGQEQVALTHQFSPQALAGVNELSMPDLRSNLDNSINFEFMPPPDWLSGEIVFNLEAVTGDAAEAQPVVLTIAKKFAVRKPLRVAYLPIKYQDMRPTEPEDAAYWMLRMYPVPDVEYYRLPVPEMVLDGNMNKSEVLRKLLYSYWFYARSHPVETRPDQLFGWLPQEFYNGGASDPFWCPNCAGPHSSRVAFGGARPEQDIGGPRILVHEIAHNLGAQHAWSPTYNEDNACFKAEGVDIEVDPEWPYVETPHIQEFGIDLYSDPPVIYPPSHYDMMAYCAAPWISPHTYRKIFSSPFLQPNQQVEPLLANLTTQPQIESTASGTLLVTGVIYPNGSVAQPEVITLEGDAFGAGAAFSPSMELLPPPGNDYCLNVEAHDGSSLATHCFDAGFFDLEDGPSAEPTSFFFTLPEINPNQVGKVTISKSQVEQASVTPSNTPPHVSLKFPVGGETLNGQQTISWDAYDADGDSLLFDLFYSPDNGGRWLPLAMRLSETSYTFTTEQLLPGEKMLVKVVAGDGFHTTAHQLAGTFSIQP